MQLISLMLTLALIGFALWAINAYVPMQPMVKRLLNIVVVVILILWLLSSFGILPDLDGVRFPR